MKVRNWHSRNTMRAKEIDGVTFITSIGHTGDIKEERIQLRLYDGERRALTITMTPDELHKLRAELDQRAARIDKGWER